LELEEELTEVIARLMPGKANYLLRRRN